MSTFVKAKKLPWIPPGKSCRIDQVSRKSKLNKKTEKLEEINEEITNMSQISAIESHVSSPSVENPCRIEANLSSIKEEMKLYSSHFASLKQMSLFLNSFLPSNGIDDQELFRYLSNVDNRIKESIYEFDELEYSVTYVENILPDTDKVDEYLKTIQLRGNLLAKLLESYSNITFIFRNLVHDQLSQEVLRFQKDQELLKQQLLASEEKCKSQDAIIKNLEKRLSITESKSNTIGSYNTTLEATKTELEKQLSLKEVQIKYLNSELSQLTLVKRSEDNSERLLEIIEEIKKVSNAEKNALKKALKLEKLHVKKRDESIEKLAKDIMRKDEMMFDVALQRDKLKSHLTVANNNIVEGKNQIEELKSQISKLKKELSRVESNFKDDIQDKSEALKTRKQQIHDMENENFKLKSLADSLKEDLKKSAEELAVAKSKLANPTVYLSHNPEEEGDTALAEIRHLIKLLKDSKEFFKIIQANLYSQEKSVQNDESLSKAVEDLKVYLLEIKELFGSLPKENNGKQELERQLIELKTLLSEVSRENEVLKSEIEEMKNSRVQPPQNHYSSFGLDSKFSAKSLQMELNLKNEENWRLQQRERDLEHQLEEVKERLQRREIENGKLFALEEELKSKKLEVSLLEKRIKEESERTSNKIKELQESLDKKSDDYDSLVHYVQTLKSSYLNVFGSS